MNDQRTLLAAYVANGSESAFRELVARYIDLVYSTAVRLVNGDTHRAEDVAQTVFADLARLAGTLAPDVMLGGWLHRRTWHVAATLMRHERRRQHRERQAVEMNAWQDKPEDQLERIAPLLDEAINQLGDHDRAAIVLRFFEHRDLRTIGELLGSNEDAAQKRVSRAVDKLRGHFARRGIVASATVFTSVLAAHAVHAAPVGLASTVTAASLAATTGSGVSSFASTLTQTLIMKKTTLVVLATIVAIGAVSISVVKIRHRGDTRGDGPVTAESLREGLVLDLPFDQDEADSGTITDKSGKANQGAATGVHWTADGQRGGAYEFTADGDEIVVKNNPSLNPKQMTLAAWIKTSTKDAIWRRIFDKSYSKGYALSIAGEWKGQKWNGLVSLEMGPGTHFSTTKTMVADGQWHQVVATCDGTEQRLYVDGKPEGPALRWKNPGPVGATDFNLVIGCNRSSVGDYDIGMSFRGLIDEPMMWDRALASNEVVYLFESQSGSLAAK